MRPLHLSIPLLIALSAAGRAAAGPPFVTDDPGPTDKGHWEIYAFASGAKLANATEGEGGLEFNYGAADDVQLTVNFPLGFDSDGGTHLGPGDMDVAAKYRFLRQSDGGARPDLAIFPTLTLPTGDARFGEGRPTLFLPLWAQKDFGPWSVFGGGGYQMRPGPDVWRTGLAITRALDERLVLGGEVYHHTEEEGGAGGFTGMNLGLTYKASRHWSLLASGGPGLDNRSDGKFSLYVSLKADY